MEILRLPLPKIDNERKFFAQVKFKSPEKFYFAFKNVIMKHPYYYIPVQTIPYRAVIDTLGRYILGFRLKKTHYYYGALRIEIIDEETLKLLIPPNLPKQAEILLNWAIKKLNKEKENENNSEKQKRRKVSKRNNS
ncbi:MAG: hypothetical protein QXV73_04410 [Candidatus Micrarchaeia archaeon]